jgi:hypothetical protein
VPPHPLPHPPPHPPAPSLWRRITGALGTLRRCLLRTAVFVVQVLLVAWGVGAIYYAPQPALWARYLLMAAFLMISVVLLWRCPGRWRHVLFGAIYVGLLVAWGFINPQQEREWSPEVARLPTVDIDGDRVRIANVRNFTYRSETDFDVAYNDREVLLSHLTGVDMFVSYWVPGPVGHTFLSFRFDNAPPVCISIETRPEVGEGYQPIASMFKQYEIIHVVGDERDIVGVRTHHRGEEVYLYPLQVTPSGARLLFLVYLERINDLAAEPEFYHLLKDNCTLNIVRYANIAAGKRGGFDFRQLLNGWIDRYLYIQGYVDTSLPFAELRSRSQINEVAKASPIDDDFSNRIRSQLPSATVAE